MNRTLFLACAAIQPLLGFNVDLYQKTWMANHSDPIDPFFDQLFIASVQNDPQLLSHLSLFEGMGLKEHNGELNDVSPQAIRSDFQRMKEALASFRKLPRDGWTADQIMSAEVIGWVLEHRVKGEKFLFHDFKINQLFSILSEQTLLFTQFHPLKTSEDVALYIKRLGKVSLQIDQTIQLMEVQKKLGITPPAFAMEKVVQIIHNSMPKSVSDHPFYSHLKEHTSDKTQLAAAARVIQKQIYPAYNRLIALCNKMPNKENLGAWSLPDGDAYYQHQLEFHTTTSLTADEIHELGLREVNRIQAQMKAVLAKTGIADMAELAKNRQFYYPNTDEGRRQCLKDYEKILERCRSDLYPLFDLKPSEPVRIQAVPKHEEIGSPMAYYLEASLDRSRPGVFFTNLGNMDQVPQFQMETLTVHEAEPGHHFQISLQQEMDIPILRKCSAGFNAYLEGWALYVEKLAFEEGFYSSPESQLGHLQFDLLRAVRLVVDTGIHKKQWSREKAIDYMQKVTGQHIGAVINEVERYFVYPAQACSYKIGQLKILELREKAKTALGEQFDIQKFHNVILQTGAAPLTLLETQIDEKLL